MKMPIALTFLLLAVSAAAQAPRNVSRPSAQTIREWQSRKFGMFIHWGLYSIPGGVWNGKKITNGYSEQIMSHAPIPKGEYEKLAAQFNPTKWDPEAVVALAKAAGMRFIVITSKHHDGFAMFQTKTTNYNVVDATPYHKDVVKQLSEACARNGIKFGVYYSTIDWHHPDATPWTDDNNNPIPPKHADLNVAQLQELTTRYGPLTELWFDMGKPTPDQSKRFADTVHTNQSQCMVSGRVFNHQGDFTVMGDNALPEFVIDEPWQTPASIYDETWGYRSWQDRSDLNGKINEHIEKLVKVVSRGGNYLLNIGPEGDGSIVEFEADVLNGVGKWLSTNGEAIYGGQPQPFRTLDFGYATVKPRRLYLLVEKWPADGLLRLPGLKTPIRKAYLLADTAKAPLGIENDVPAIRVTKKVETPPVTVVAVELDTNASVIPPLVRPDAAGKITLTAAEADVYYNYNGYGYYEPPTIYKKQWHFEVPSPGHYRVDVIYKDAPAAVRAEFDVDGRHVIGDFGASSGEHTVNIAVLQLVPRPYSTLTITPPHPFPKGTKLGMNIENVVLTREAGKESPAPFVRQPLRGSR